MASQWWSFGLAVFALFFLGFDRISGLNVEYCSPVNTADTPGSRSPSIFFCGAFTDPSSQIIACTSRMVSANNSACLITLLQSYKEANVIAPTTSQVQLLMGANAMNNAPDIQTICAEEREFTDTSRSTLHQAQEVAHRVRVQVRQHLQRASPHRSVPPFVNPSNYSISLSTGFDFQDFHSVASCLPMPINGNRFDFLL